MPPEEKPPQPSEGALMDWMRHTFDPWLESRRHSNTLIIFFILLAVIPIIGVGLATTRTILPRDWRQYVPQLPSSSITAYFDCADGKSLTAIFSSNTVKLSLSDGRHIGLPQTVSGSGARYANSDESFVFWNKGNTAFIEEGGKQTYTDCVTQG